MLIDAIFFYWIRWCLLKHSIGMPIIEHFFQASYNKTTLSWAFLLVHPRILTCHFINITNTKYTNNIQKLRKFITQQDWDKADLFEED